ncbi:MAG: N-acetylmuramic acid 6-phosphate etherase [Chlamydiia bacterium]|nr:N-acetylmuramic acid 6-phosphate etherase [Chlamydiia bacterium]
MAVRFGELHKKPVAGEAASAFEAAPKGAGPLLKLPEGCEPYEEFAAKFSLGKSSTELLCDTTRDLSQVMNRDITGGLRALFEVDKSIIAGYENFIPKIHELSPEIAERIQAGGRVIMLGSGTSGRISVDLAKKWQKIPEAPDGAIIGDIAGKDSAMIKAREGYEDSTESGRSAIEEHSITEKDTVILLSASGSASFNVGAGHAAANLGAKVMYFYNSTNVPERTEELFERARNPVIPLLVDIGPQAIAGSTRLQAATLAEACIGALLTATFVHIRDRGDLVAEFTENFKKGLERVLLCVESKLDNIANFVEIEEAVFSHPSANFRSVHDDSKVGYVTFVATPDAIIETMVDATETSPTFSTNPPRRESEAHKKAAEFRAYVAGCETNEEAWEKFVGRNPNDPNAVSDFILSMNKLGECSYANRPLCAGNFAIGVCKLKKKEVFPLCLSETLNVAYQEGAETGVIVTSPEKLEEAAKDRMRKDIDASLFLDDIPPDPLGILETIALKLALNLISNGAMLRMQKVYGNRMIDSRASNSKLIDRCMRNISGIWTETNGELPLTQEELYHAVVLLHEAKTQSEERGVYAPSVAKLALGMLALGKTPADFGDIVVYIAEKKENIDDMLAS